MNELLERLRRLRSDAAAWAGKLSPRERVMVATAAAAVVVFTVYVVSLQISRGIAQRELRVEAKTKVVSQIGKLAEGYRRQQAERKAIEAKLKGPPLQLMSFISQTGATIGVEVNDLRPTGAPTESAGVVEESVEVNLARIEPGRLGRLLQALERGPGVVRVRRIRLTTRNDDPALVDATIVVSTYQLRRS
ncbi:MAG TPA: type II secretion system protein GspM [Anaeromyxobacteraceae bacterium]|nr:type II secretion system protein GspM [Anaeromyxobacteraceae bacterium]